jgi:cytoskeletal protein CcmA (bactofilin family)
MIRVTRACLLTLLCIAVVGCAAAREEQKAALSAPTANVAGTWTGNAGTSSESRPVTLTLNQTGTNVTGNLSIAGRPDLSGPIKGAVQGEIVKLSTATATFAQLRAQQDTMTGQMEIGQVILRRQK